MTNKDFTETPEQTIERLAEGLKLEARFVPFSQSRHAEPEGAAKPWKSLNWKVTIFGNGLGRIDCDYSQGTAHCPAYKNKRLNKLGGPAVVREAIALEIETGRVHCFSNMNGRAYQTPKRIDPPSIVDVLASLAMDADVLDYVSFADWAECFGYSSDSIKAREIYDECIENALKLRATFGASDLEELMEAARER